MSSVFIPRLRDILFIAIMVATLALGQRMLNTDGDLGRHLTVGGYILETGQIPTHDLFSHTRPGDPRPAYEWLTQFIFAIANIFGGIDGTLLVADLIIASAYMIVQADSTRRNRMPLTSLAITVLAAAASSLHWLPRPHVVTFLLLAIWLERLERIRVGESIPLWQFPVLMVIWVNTHGGFLFGFLVWTAYMGGWIVEWIRRTADKIIGRKFILIGGFSLAATLITPNLWGNWTAVLGNNSRYILSRTLETASPDFTQYGTWPFAFMVLLAIIVLVVMRASVPISHVFLMIGFATLGLLFARNIPLFAIASSPIISIGAREVLFPVKRWVNLESNVSLIESRSRGFVFPLLIVLGVSIIVGVHYQVDKSSYTHFDKHVFPVAAADWLEENPQTGNMFNEFNWGGYLLFRLWPGQKVFLDSQTDFYGDKLVREYVLVISAHKGWEMIFEKYSIEWVVLPVSTPLINTLRTSGWDTLYQDTTAVVLRDSH